MHFPIRGVFLRQVATIYAVDGVSFHIRKERPLGWWGISECGKTMVVWCIIRLHDSTDGPVDLGRTCRRKLRAVRWNGPLRIPKTSATRLLESEGTPSPSTVTNGVHDLPPEKSRLGKKKAH